MALAVPLSRFTSRIGGGSAFFVRNHFCMWHNVFENAWPALVGAGVVGVAVGLTKRRPVPQILLVVLVFVLLAVTTQIAWELFPQFRRGKNHVFVVLAVSAVICLPFSFWMRSLERRRDHDA